MYVKLLLCGAPGSGKSTLLRRLLAQEEALWGFETCFGPALGGPEGVYLHRAGTPPQFAPENRVGVRGAKPGQATGDRAVFETLGVSLLQDIPAGAAVLLDELGYLEQDAVRFLAQAEQVLTGPFRVAGAIKPLPYPHLERLRSLPGVHVLHLTAENRDMVYARAQALWNAGKK